MEPKQLICKYIAGSRSYGLDTPDSDTDYRGVFLHEDVGDILDPHQYTNHATQCYTGATGGQTDSAYHELRKFFHILRAGNTTAIEMLFNTKWESNTEYWTKIQAQRKNLLSPEKFYRALTGYIHSELRLAVGERTGKLGGKRFAVLQKVGYSPKNVVNLIRLTYAGAMFFRDGVFPLDFRAYPCLHQRLMEIKLTPEKYTKEEAVGEVATYRALLDDYHQKYRLERQREYQWDESVVKALTLACYYPVLGKYHRNSFFKSCGAVVKRWLP